MTLKRRLAELEQRPDLSFDERIHLCFREGTRSMITWMLVSQALLAVEGCAVILLIKHRYG